MHERMQLMHEQEQHLKRAYTAEAAAANGWLPMRLRCMFVYVLCLVVYVMCVPVYALFRRACACAVRVRIALYVLVYALYVRLYALHVRVYAQDYPADASSDFPRM